MKNGQITLQESLSDSSLDFRKKQSFNIEQFRNTGIMLQSMGLIICQ